MSGGTGLESNRRAGNYLPGSTKMDTSRVPREGLEPTLPHGKRILSPPRLPFRHLGAESGPPMLAGVSKNKEAASGFEPLYRGFADPCLNLLATPPNQIPQQASTTGTTFSLERKTRFELATSSLARKHSTAELLPLLSQILPLLCGFSKPNLVPRGRLELPRAHAHHPLKMACLPIPPPRHGRGGRTRTHDRRFWRPLLYQTELRPCNH